MHFRSEAIHSLLPVCITMAAGICASAWALPEGGQVSSGNAGISAAGNTMTVAQGSARLVIDWNGFGVKSGEVLNFSQPSPASIVLNRVRGQDASQIMGSLNANGQVFLSNPNGILFGAHAQVNVAGLVASTHHLSDADFNAGVYRFAGNGLAASVVNQGTLTASDHGYIALLAPQVINQGIISARLGTALLAAGNQVTVTINDGSLIGYNIDSGALDALADNRSLVKADGGRVFMAAQAASQLARAVVNNDGVVEAKTVQEQAGVIRLMGDMQAGRVSGNGRLDASAPDGGNGGAIETSAAHVALGANAIVTAAAPFGRAGSWLIDPTDYLLNFNSVTQDGTATNVLNALQTTDVTISTASPGNDRGNITLEGQLNFGYNHTLTLIADSDIILRPDTTVTLQASGVATPQNTPGNLVLKAGFGNRAGGKLVFGAGAFITDRFANSARPPGTLTLYYTPSVDGTPDPFTVGQILMPAGSLTTWLMVNNAQQLQAMNSNATALGSNFAMAFDIDAAATRGWNNGAGFVPVGTGAAPFTGQFDGMGRVIRGLYINRPNDADGTGLFGVTRAAFQTNPRVITNGIANLGLIDATIVGGRAATGALVGENFAMRISNDYVTGSANAAGAGSSVTGSGNGEYYDALRGVAATGGLVGSTRGPVENSWSDATVIGRVYTGGLVGRNLDDIRTSYSTGPVTGTRFVGGLVGGNQNTAGFQFAVENSYSTSMVSGQESIGGLVGENSGTMRNVYSKSARIGPASGRGGLAGINNLGLWEGAAFWDAQSSTAAQAFGSGTAAAALKGLTSAGMTASLATLGLDASTWLTYQGRTAPLLKNFLRPVSVVINDQLRQTYNGSNAAVPSALRSVLKFSRQGVVDPALAFDPNIFLDAQTSGPAINVGRYAVNLSLWSNQKGYDITGSTLGKTVSLVIYPRNLVLTPKPIQKVYDGSTSAGTEVDASNLVAGHTVRASQSLDRADVTIDSNDLRTLTIGPNPAIFAGTQNVTANYFIQPPRPLRSAATRITPRALTVSANGDTRFAGTTPYSGGNGFTVTGLLPGQGNEVLSGQVRYGGTAQGASREGRYTIEPSGLSARNYAITFVNGELVIRKAVGFSGVAAPLVEAVDDAAADIEHADDEEGMFIDRELVAYPAMGIIGGHASRQPAYSIIDRGVRLPIEAGP